MSRENKRHEQRGSTQAVLPLIIRILMFVVCKTTAAVALHLVFLQSSRDASVAAVILPPFLICMLVLGRCKLSLCAQEIMPARKLLAFLPAKIIFARRYTLCLHYTISIKFTRFADMPLIPSAGGKKPRVSCRGRG